MLWCESKVPVGGRDISCRVWVFCEGQVGAGDPGKEPGVEETGLKPDGDAMVEVRVCFAGNKSCCQHGVFLGKCRAITKSKSDRRCRYSTSISTKGYS